MFRHTIHDKEQGWKNEAGGQQHYSTLDHWKSSHVH